MRSLYIVTIAFLALTVGYLIWQTVLGSSASTPPTAGELKLVDLPSRYCPTEARVVTTLENAPEQTGKILPVTACRSIALASIINATKDGGQLYIKLPGALPFSLDREQLSATGSYAPELGDITNDGVIDSADEAAIIEQLTAKTTDPALDLTGDGVVDAEDLSLVRLHQGVGATIGPQGELVLWERVK